MILPLLAGAGLLWLLLSSKPSSPAPAPLPAAPPPAPPPSDKDILRAHVADLLRMADVAPDLVNPDAMDAAAVQLESAGLPIEAEAVRSKATQLRARLGTPPPPQQDRPEPRPQTPQPSKLPDALLGRIDAVMTTPEADPVSALVIIDNIERRFGKGSFFDVTSRLKARAKELHKQRATIPEAIELSQQAATKPNTTSPSVLEFVADDLPIAPGVQESLRKRATQMRAQGLGIVIHF